MYLLEKLVVGPVKTNCYILSDENKDCVIFDIGDDGNNVADFIKLKGYKPLAILLTHGHFDHISGVNDFKKTYNIDVYGNKYDADLALNGYASFYSRAKPNVIIEKYLVDNEVLSIGNFKIKVLFTAGHTKGCVVYFIDNFMFSGDTLFNLSVGRTDLPHSNNTDMNSSLKMIKKIEKNYQVLPGHGKDSTLLFELQHNVFLQRVV